ncbi:hypothetical protein AB834_05405 [PVC group bacterium (ex Bugula neritina AB1)]|nr:hypothetical protein AB834_05405 [PVC group bacterium (ex Bugula neritina AB1)]
MKIPFAVEERPDTGLNNGRFGIWLFLASELMLFGGLFSAYILLRTGSSGWPKGADFLNIPLATVNTVVLISSSVTIILAWIALQMNNVKRFRILYSLTILLGFIFLIIKYFEYSAKFHHHYYPSTNTFLAIYFTMTGLHVLHILGGLLVNIYHLFPGFKLYKEDPEKYKGRIELSGIYWHFVDLVWIFLFPILYLL